MAEPDPPASLHRRGQRHVVDQRAAHRRDAADPLAAPGARISMVPPAAAAVARSGSFTQANGYSNWKKNTKAGTSARSAGLSQVSAHHLRDQVEVAALGLRDQGGHVTPVVHDVGVGQQHQFGRARLGQALRDRPQLAAPAGRPRRARPAPSAADRRCRARCAPVPSLLPSSTRMTRSGPA